MICPECDAPIKQRSTHCLECGVAIYYAAPSTINAQRLPSLPIHAQPNSIAPSLYQPVAQPLAVQATSTSLGYEPSILAQWVDQLRAMASQTLSVQLVARGIYFLVIGIWLSQLWMIFAWLMSLTGIGIPIAKAMLRVQPTIAFMSQQQLNLEPAEHSVIQSPPIGIRALYFFVVGWWVTLLWLELAWVAGVTIIGLPLARAMVQATPTVQTLRRF